MIEVEIKAKIDDPASLRKKIIQKKLAKYIGKQIKIDDYYTLEDLKSYPKKSLRIRKKGPVYEVNFKQAISYTEGTHAKKETEFKTEHIDDILTLLQDFGFKRWLRKEKVTYLYKIKNNFHIELNYVKSLGWFIEIEYLARPSKIKPAQKHVQRIFKELDISPSHQVKEGYTKMLWNVNKLGI